MYSLHAISKIRSSAHSDTDFASRNSTRSCCVVTWHALLLIYPRLDVRVPLRNWRSTRFTHRLSDAEVRDGVQSFEAFPDLAAELTSGRIRLEPTIHTVDRVLDTLSCENGQPKSFWPSPDETHKELRRIAPVGKYESIFVYWPQNDFAAHTSIPCRGWGLGMGASAWSHDATYATVANAPSSAWKVPRAGEVWLHEWLHGVCAQYAARGIPMPDGDADGAGRHGYIRSAENGWTDYYRDLMNGRVLDAGMVKGIPTLAWEDKPFDRSDSMERFT